MKLMVALLGALVSALVGYALTKLFDYFFKILKGKPWVLYAVAGVFALGFIFAYSVSPYFRDVLKAWFNASPTERQCFFDAQIDKPKGADAPSGAHGFLVDPTTLISWTPTNCVLVIQAYQSTVLLNQVEDRNPEEATILYVTNGHIGTIELKIFQRGFVTASDSVWIEVK